MHDRLFLIGGGMALVAAIVLSRLGLEPIATWLCPIAWWLTLVLLDALVYRRKGESLFTSAREVAVLAAASVAFWCLFEIANLRLQNWYYVNMPRHLIFRLLGEVVSFATVLPALFEVADLLEAYGLFPGTPVPPITITTKVERWMTAAGVACLLSALALPTVFYPLIWLVPILLIEPWLYALGVPSLLADFASGQTRRIKLLACAGLLCGLLWEAYNGQARAGWYYAVPGFGRPYYFHMPLVGLLGFLPFALSAYSFWVLLDTFQGGRGWRLGEWPAERAMRLEKALPARRLWPVAAGGALVAIAGLLLLERFTVDSLRPVGSDIPEHERYDDTLHSFGLSDPFVLARKGYGRNAAALALERGVPLGEVGEAIEQAALLTIAGLGAENARLLRRVGVDSISGLALAEPDALVVRLRAIAVAAGRRPPSIYKIRNWVREARGLVAERGTLR